MANKKVFNPLGMPFDTVRDNIADLTTRNASDVVNTPAGNIVATNVQTAINELDTEKVPYIGGTGNVDIGDFELRAQTLEADVATGTTPLTIASTTKVTNLNADLLDGLHDTGYTKTTAGQTITVGVGKDYTTIQSAYNAINPVIIGNVIISIDAGTYTENLVLGGKVASGLYNILFQAATRTTDLNTTATGGTAGNSTTQATVIKTGAGWTVNAYRGKWLRFTSGTLNGEIKLINGNTADTLTLVGDYFSAAPANGNAFVIESNNVNIVGDHTINPTTIELQFKHLKLQNVTIKQAFIQFMDCWRATNLYSKNKWEYVVVYETRTYQTIASGALNGAVWTYGSSHDLDECLFFGMGKNVGSYECGILPRAGGYLLAHNGTTFDSFDRALWVDLMALVQLWDGSKARNSRVRVQNSVTGVGAWTGSHVQNSPGNTYTNNTTNEYADAVSYSWIG